MSRIWWALMILALMVTSIVAMSVHLYKLAHAIALSYPEFAAVVPLWWAWVGFTTSAIAAGIHSHMIKP